MQVVEPRAPGMPQRVLVVDDSPVVRNRVRSLLAETPGVRVVGEAEGVADAVAAIRLSRPDAVILDMRLRNGTGLEVLERVRDLTPPLRVVLLTNYDQQEYRDAARALGAVRFLDKSREFDRVAEALGLVPADPVLTGARGADERWQALIEHSSDMIIVIDPRGRISYASPSSASILGYDPGENVGRDFAQFVHPDDVQTVGAAFEELVAGAETARREARVRRKDGGWLWTEATATNRLEDPRVRGIVLNVRDVSERLRVVEALRVQVRRQEAIARLGQRALANGGLDALFADTARTLREVLDVEYATVFELEFESEGAALRLRGGDGWPDGVLGRWTVGAGLASQPGYTLVVREPVVADDLATERRFETPAVVRDHQVVSGMTCVVGDPAAPYGVLGVDSTRRRTFTTADVTFLQTVANLLATAVARHASDSATRRLEERFRIAAETTADGIWEYDVATGASWWSDNTFALAGVAPGALDPSGDGWAQAVHPDDRARVRRELAAAVAGTGDRLDQQFRGVRADGSVAYVEGRARVIRDVHGTATRLIGAVSDVTRQRRIETQFRQAQRLEAVGRLAGGVAHDFNNILSAILGYGQLLKEDIAAGTPRGADLDEILRAAGRARDLTRQLLAFSRQQVLDLRVLEVNGVVEGVRNMLGRLLGEDVDLALRLDPAAGCLKADAGQLEQVIMNLVVNARDAMPGGGRLTIETAAVDLDAAYAQAHEPLGPGPYVLLAVSDTGCGMTADVKARVFEPFFTTKGPHQGTGLGLSTVYGIVKQSGGFIWVYSEPGQGTTFKIYLPRVAERAAPAPAPHAPAAVGGRETILLVEDDAAVRRSTTQLLERMGYTVLAAARGEAALAIVSGSSRAIDLLLSDVVLPDLSGPQLARLLDGLRPGIRVLFMSGYADAAIVRHGILDAGASFLQKPAMPDALARKIREVLDNRGGSRQ